MSKIKCHILNAVGLLMINSLMAQSPVVVSGVVKNATNNRPVAGATIHTLLQKKSVVADSGGAFEIKTGNGDTLVISRIGFVTRAIPVMNIGRHPTITLDEVNRQLEDVTINTGYQKFKPNEVNGSYEVIDNKRLNQQTGLNILDRLNGVTSSLLVNIGKENNNPQNKTNITIRGYSTINGPLDPLIVVDNFIYDGDINNINPNDVESVTVLKDAAATSIWGARAGNGVIVITTKKGKFNQKLQVDFNSDVIVTDKPDLFNAPQISVPDYIDYEQFLFGKGYYNAQITNRLHPVISPAVRVFQDRLNGLISAGDSASEITALKANDSRRQFTDYYYRKALTQQYALNLRGGSRNLAWLISGTYDKNIGNLHSGYDKVNLRFENTYRPLKSLQINAGVYYTNSTSLSGMPGYQALATINNTRYIPYLPLAGKDGSSIAVPQQYDLRYLDTLGGGKLLDWEYYPMTDYLHSRARANIEEMLAHISLDYKIIRGLDISLLYQYQKQNADGNTLYDTASVTAGQVINNFSQIDRATGIITYIVPPGGILNKSYSSLGAYNFRGQLSFDRSFSTLHHINAIAGVEIRDEWASSNSAVYYGYTEDPLNYATNLDFQNYYPTLLTGGLSTIPAASGGLTATDNRFVSFFSNASYSYKDRYFISGSMRKDGSNIFGANTNDKWKPLWSAGLGWELSKERFYHIAWLPYLKLITTYGVSGNVDLSKTAVPVATVGTSYHTNLPYESITTINNPDLSWERNYQLNFRLAFATANNVLNGSVEYYKKKGTDLYAPTQYDYTTWGVNNTIIANAADMKGHRCGGA